jgi:hypothetical protein
MTDRQQEIMLFRKLRRLFALETLDTRFFVHATTPPKEALEDAAPDPAKALPAENGRAKGRDAVSSVSPPRWKTPEYYLYFLIIALAVPWMCKTVYDVSKRMGQRQIWLPKSLLNSR